MKTGNICFNLIPHLLFQTPYAGVKYFFEYSIESLKYRVENACNQA